LLKIVSKKVVLGIARKEKVSIFAAAKEERVNRNLEAEVH